MEKNKKSDAYNLGWDCGINGPNTVNCSFTLFASPERMKDWEQGKNDAVKAKADDETQFKLRFGRQS